MKTRILMSASAALMALLGLALSFLPQEILAVAGVEAEGPAVVLAQVLGALYLGFAILNWMARGLLLGGIYARPLVLGNFLHFAVVAIVLVKVLAAGSAPAVLWAGTVVYVVFAVWFGGVLFIHPSSPS